MTTNPYFLNFTANNEQDLLHNLTIEAIQAKGYDVSYVVRDSNNKDPIYKEEEYSTFTDNYTIEMYIKNVDGFAGDGAFLSKFGLEIRDQITFSVSQRIFANTITNADSTIVRPREGDIIYASMLNRIFEIKSVDNRAEFYPLGSLPVFNMTCEIFEYSNEIFNTGIEEIDRISTKYATNQEAYEIENESGLAITNEANTVLLMNEFNFDDNDISSRNTEIDLDANDFLDFSEDNPFGES